MLERKKILLIGGTEEALKLNRIFTARTDIDLVTSLAGRTASPASLAGAVVTGGFGGGAGFTRFIAEHHISMVIDASHPFAETITRTAFEVCRANGVPFLRYQRPAWVEQAGDRWIAARNVEEAAWKLDGFERIFLTIGRQELSPFEKIAGKIFLVRSIETVDFNPPESAARFIRARGPFPIEDELRLLTDNKIDLLVSKNSGGAATYAKIEAARRLQTPVLMIDRPSLPDCRVLSDMNELVADLNL